MALPEEGHVLADATRRMLATVAERPIPRHIVERAEGKISEDDVIAVIRATGSGSSPGPVGIPSEV